MWKINTISIRDFKFFHKEFELNLKGNNLLLYGENGSGKSSIYYSLYTLYQSYYKTPAEVAKYFDPNHKENLLNKYAKNTEDSYIEIEFVEDSGTTKSIRLDKTVTDLKFNVDDFWRLTVQSSDVLNYKNLLSITNFKNSKDNEIYNILLEEVLPFASFSQGYTDISTGNRTSELNAIKWLEYIYSELPNLPKQSGKRRNQLDRSKKKYADYVNLLWEYREELKKYLDEVAAKASKILHDKFEIPEVDVCFEIDKTWVFNIPTNKGSRHRDHILHDFHVYLWPYINNAAMEGGRTQIYHPATYFNEAKLTCIGLAIRLAVMESRLGSGANWASTLCIDDLLVSLDMGYRIPVVRTLLEYSSQYQLIIFTHDRSLYHLFNSERNSMGMKTNWLVWEMYAPSKQKAKTEEPHPLIVKDTTYDAKALGYIYAGDYQAAGNCIRKLAEEKIKAILPLNLTLDIDNEGNIKQKMLRSLYQTICSPNFIDLYSFPKTEVPSIDRYLNLLMNPLSHDNKSVPLYRSELEKCLAEVLKFAPIADSKKVLVKQQDVMKSEFQIQVTNGVDSAKVVFRPIEQWDYFDRPTKLFKNCEVEILSSDVPSIPVKTKMRINVVRIQALDQTKLKRIGNELEKIVYDKKRGVYLSAL